MNNLKFRAWDKLQEEMWHVRSINFDTDVVWLVESEDEPDQAFMVNNTDVIVERFTGIYDSLGVEIYEGDIINTKGWTNVAENPLPDEVFTVIWDRCGFVTTGKNGEWFLLRDWDESTENIEVIGNVHEVNHE